MLLVCPVFLGGLILLVHNSDALKRSQFNLQLIKAFLQGGDESLAVKLLTCAFKIIDVSRDDQHEALRRLLAVSARATRTRYVPYIKLLVALKGFQPERL